MDAEQGFGDMRSQNSGNGSRAVWPQGMEFVGSALRLGLALAILAGSLLAGAAWAQTAVLPGNHPREAANLAWRAPASRSLNIHISFALRNRGALAKLLADLQNPASPSYHRWLTPAAFDARFGRTQGEAAAVSAWLLSQGFQVKRSTVRTIDATATVTQAESAFATSIAGSGDGALYANSATRKFRRDSPV